MHTTQETAHNQTSTDRRSIGPCLNRFAYYTKQTTINASSSIRIFAHKDSKFYRSATREKRIGSTHRSRLANLEQILTHALNKASIIVVCQTHVRTKLQMTGESTNMNDARRTSTQQQRANKRDHDTR